MIVTADLDWSVACVGDFNSDGRAFLVQDTTPPAAGKISPGIILCPPFPCGSSANRVVKANEFRTIRERCFHLHFMDHFRDAFHHLIAVQNFAAFGREVSDRLAVARSLHDEICE